MSTDREIFGFRILARIGQGAASQLYAVQDPKTKQVWSLKHVMKNTEKDQRFIDQVEQEAAIGSKLDHANLRGTERIMRKRKRFKVVEVALLMELVDGTTLDQKLPDSQVDAVRLFVQVARALDHMHSRGFVHADIKPNNILITDDGSAKIIDLGQACKTGTIKKRVQGTPGYIAPEQGHQKEITPRTDIYNLGATMYWILTREVIPTVMPPKEDQEGLFAGAIDTSRVNAPVPPHEKNPTVHPLLSKQIMDCVSLEPIKRPESMAIVANRLEMIADLLENPPADIPISETGETTF
ncbi:MAG: hypothetical protein CMJ32_05665 [Phycisphaerae bacterium]|nr:hypothetical protein [Phycisphaerae bacterium]